MFLTSGTLPAEIIGGNGIDVCYLEDVTQEREICWEPTLVQHEERPDRMGSFIWRWGDGNGRYHLCQGWENFHRNYVPHKGTMVWKFYDGLETTDEIN